MFPCARLPCAPRDLTFTSSPLAAAPDLNTSYVDLFLLHYPDCWGDLCGGDKPKGTFLDSWRALEQLYDKGLARAIGGSPLVSAQQPCCLAHVPRSLVPHWNALARLASLVWPVRPSTCTSLSVEEAFPGPCATNPLCLSLGRVSCCCCHAGVSNFMPHQLQQLLAAARVRPAVLQVHVDPLDHAQVGTTARCLSAG